MARGLVLTHVKDSLQELTAWELEGTEADDETVARITNYFIACKAAGVTMRYELFLPGQPLEGDEL